MAPFYKVLGTSSNLVSNTTVGNAKLVRILAKANTLITHINAAANATQGTIQMNGGTEFVLNKKAADTLSSNDAAPGGNVICVAVSFTN